MTPHKRGRDIVVEARPDSEDVPDAIDGDGAAEGFRCLDEPGAGVRVAVGEGEAGETGLLGLVAVAAAGTVGGGCVDVGPETGGLAFEGGEVGGLEFGGSEGAG